MTLSDTTGPRRRGAAPEPSRVRSVAWSDWLLTAAAAVGLFASIQAWFDWRSGIQGEPGTLLVIAACALILFGLAVTAMVDRGGIRRLFQWLILLGAVLTALAAWFLMSWVLLGSMIVAALAQIVRMTRARH